MSTSDVIGVVVITRHGDREGYYQSPTSYTASDTTITPLGSQQKYQSGQAFAAKYLQSNSSTYVNGVSYPGIKLSQLSFSADAAEGQVITDSAYAFAQGAFPPNSSASSNTQVLADGTSVTDPLGGYTYIPVSTIDPTQQYSFEGFANCPTFTARNTALYNSTLFNTIATEAKPFLTSIQSLLAGRSISFSNMYNIFDYFNVNYIHTPSFYSNTTSNTLSQTRSWANIHEQLIFTDPSLDGIGNIAGQTILGPVLKAMDGIVSGAGSDEGLKVAYIGVAYKPFLSLFNMTQVGEELYGMVGYASAAVYEIHNTSGTINVVFNFRNNSPIAPYDGHDFQTYPLFGSSSNSTPYTTFVSNLSPHAITTLSDWCHRCNQTTLLGCDTIFALNDTEKELQQFEGTGTGNYAGNTQTVGKFRTSPVVSGLIGALVGMVLAGLFFVGMEWWRKRRNGRWIGKGKGKARLGGGGGLEDEGVMQNSYELDGKQTRSGKEYDLD